MMDLDEPIAKLIRRRSSLVAWDQGRRNKRFLIAGVGFMILQIILIETVLSFRSLRGGASRRVVVEDELLLSRYERKLLEQANTDDYKCRGFRTTVGFTPFALPRLFRYLFSFVGVLHSCDEAIPQTTDTGYCELIHKTTGEVLKVFHQSPPLKPYNTKQGAPYFKCSMAHGFYHYMDHARDYEPYPSLFSTSSQPDKTSSNRGIVIQVYPSALSSTYALIQLLRKDYGCDLPIELWSHVGDSGFEYEDHYFMDYNPIMKQLLEEDPLITRRFIWDYRYLGFLSKPYMIAYSHFDEVLYVDNDNFPLRDPTFLFDSPQYKTSSALLWKDFWSPARDDFFIRSNSVLWELLRIEKGSSFTKEEEAESGQMVINRRKSEDALKMLLYFTSTFSHWFEPMALVNGDKDLFRLAWYLTGTDYHLVEKLPNIAGNYETGGSSPTTTCGDTVVQHDPSGNEELFYHRTHGKIEGNQKLVKRWFHGDKFVGKSSEEEEEDEYSVSRFYNEDTKIWCFYPSPQSKHSFESIDYKGTKIERLEDTILAYARESLNLEGDRMQQY